MAEAWYPNPSVTQLQHERLMGGAAASGVYGTPADLPVVYAPNSGTREVRIRASKRAVVEGYGWENDAVEIVVPSLAANGTGSTRIDLVVLRLDRSDWSVRVKVVQGTAGAGAPSPTYTIGSSGVWELPLAEVSVAPGATVLAAATVTNRAWYIGSNGQLISTPTTRPPAEAGATTWDTTLSRYLVSTGVRWDPVAPMVVRKTIDEAVASSTTVQNDDQLFLTVVDANTIWSLDVYLRYLSPASPGIKIKWSVPSGTVITWVDVNSGRSELRETDTLTIPASGVAENSRLAGTVSVGATPGAIQLQWAQSVSNATPTNVQALSWMRMGILP